jgi:UDP-N-acetylmuramate dehydrogenase
VGGVPIQNVGAYGQEVQERILVVSAIDTQNNMLVQFSNAECEFEYRRSRFKFRDRGRYIITVVKFLLSPEARCEPRYPELRRRLEVDSVFSSLEPGGAMLTRVREIVLELRRSKSMVLDADDPNTVSCGSFFMNPVLNRSEYDAVVSLFQAAGGRGDVPFFEAGDFLKVPAAWLVERSGFPKGFFKGGAGISSNHSLALINRGGTTVELLALAADIQARVRETFGVELEREPVIV